MLDNELFVCRIKSNINGEISLAMDSSEKERIKNK